MRSIWGLYNTARSQDDDDAGITGVTNSLTTLTTQVGTLNGYVVGSINVRLTNVASVPATIPVAGVTLFDTTRKVLIVSDGASMFLSTTGSAA